MRWKIIDEMIDGRDEVRGEVELPTASSLLCARHPLISFYFIHSDPFLTHGHTTSYRAAPLSHTPAGTAVNHACCARLSSGGAT